MSADAGCDVMNHRGNASEVNGAAVGIDFCQAIATYLDQDIRGVLTELAAEGRLKAVEFQTRKTDQSDGVFFSIQAKIFDVFPFGVCFQPADKRMARNKHFYGHDGAGRITTLMKKNARILQECLAFCLAFTLNFSSICHIVYIIYKCTR